MINEKFVLIGALLSVKSWSLGNYGFPLYILLDCVLLYALIQFRLGKTLFKSGSTARSRIK